MNKISKAVQLAVALVAIMALAACGSGAQANPTATVVDVNSVMTSAAATAFVQLTQIAGQASATAAPTQTATPAPPTNSDFGFYPVVMNQDWEKTVKVVQLTWKTSMTLCPTTRVNSEDVQTACVIIRKQEDN